MRYVSPHLSIIGSAVAGSVTATYLNSWLTDGLPGYPARTEADLSLTVSPSPAQMVDVIAVCHHDINEAASITLGGSLASTIETQPHQSNDIPANWYRLLDTAVSVSSLVLDITGNGGPVHVGELYAGLSRTLPALRLTRRLAPDKVFPWEGEFSSLAPYDRGLNPALRITGNFVLTETELNELDECFLAQRNGNRPVLILPDYPVNVAWLCQFNYEAEDFVPGTAPVDGSPVADEPVALFTASMEIVVIPPLRWP